MLFAARMSGSLAIPLGSKRLCANFETFASSRMSPKALQPRRPALDWGLVVALADELLASDYF